MASKIGIHWKLKFYVLYQYVLGTFHHQDFTTILQSHRCYCPNLQLVKLRLRQQILQCLTQEGAELRLELRSDLPPNPSFHCSAFSSEEKDLVLHLGNISESNISESPLKKVHCFILMSVSIFNLMSSSILSSETISSFGLHWYLSW